jgi:hypothetical protein
MKQLYILCHLGMGDMIVLNGMVRHLSPTCDKIYLPCKNQNIDSVKFMFRDDPKVEVMPVSNDAHAKAIADVMRPPVYEVMRLGMFSREPFDICKWDQEFYRQANVPFEKRWSAFKLMREKSTEIQPPGINFVLAHEDPSRGCLLKPELLPPDVRIIRTERKGNIFQWCKCIEAASQLHFMESSMAALADTIEILDQRRVMHAYVRKSIPPTFRSPWEQAEEAIKNPWKPPPSTKEVSRVQPKPPVAPRNAKWDSEMIEKSPIALPTAEQVAAEVMAAAPGAAKKKVDEVTNVL